MKLIISILKPHYAIACAVAVTLGLMTLACTTGCTTIPTPTPTPTPTPAPAPGTVTVTATELALIQTGSTVATGAILNFAVTQPAQRTTLANQIYASASALYQASGGTPLTPAALNALLTSYGVSGVSQYTSYVTAVNGLYQTYYAKYVTGGSTGVQNFTAIVNALAAGAESGASAYATVTTTATTP